MSLSRIALALAATAVAGAALLASARQEFTPPKPGEQHKLLERMVGTWDAEVAMMGMPPSQATYVTKLDHGGMWLRGEFKGKFEGMGDFSGSDTTGYDAQKKKYVSLWIDSWSDYLMPAEGEFDAKTNTLAMWVEGRDAATGAPKRSRHDTKLVDADTMVFTMNDPGPDGKLAPVMTITYKRKK